MNKTMIVLMVAFLMIIGCSNKQPIPDNPISISAIPKDTVKVTGMWKMGKFVLGYRIITDEWVIASGYGGLFGEEGRGLGGPGMVAAKTVSTFGEIVDIAKQAKKNNKPMIFYGEMAHLKDTHEPFLFEKKKVLILYQATYNNRNYEVNRRTWDN